MGMQTFEFAGVLIGDVASETPLFQALFARNLVRSPDPGSSWGEDYLFLDDACWRL
jgi:hypothetical protein